MVDLYDDLMRENAPLSEWQHSLQEIWKYSLAQGDWAIKAAGVSERNNLLRDSTAACLDAYRKRGVIL